MHEQTLYTLLINLSDLLVTDERLVHDSGAHGLLLLPPPAVLRKGGSVHRRGVVHAREQGVLNSVQLLILTDAKTREIYGRICVT